jgi:hypothetical protein
VHLTIDAACPFAVGEMPLWSKDEVVLQLRITKKRFETRQNIATVKFEMFTPHEYPHD